MTPSVNPDNAHVTVGAVVLHDEDPGLAVAVYPEMVPPLPAGAVQAAVTCPSPADNVNPVGADGNPLHAAPAAADVVEVQVFNRANTVGVTAEAATVIVAEVPDTPIARVVDPSVTSYVNPDGADPTGVHDTRHVVADTRDALTPDGTSPFKLPADNELPPGADVDENTAAVTDQATMTMPRTAPNVTRADRGCLADLIRPCARQAKRRRHRWVAARCRA